LLDSLASRLVSTRPRQKVLGVILDSDPDGVRPDQAVQSRLQQIATRAGAFSPLPTVFPERGLIVDPHPNRPDANRLPRLGIWLMPNNRVLGMLEDLLMALQLNGESFRTLRPSARPFSNGWAISLRWVIVCRVSEPADASRGRLSTGSRAEQLADRAPSGGDQESSTTGNSLRRSARAIA
jgi:hypothetical protein